MWRVEVLEWEVMMMKMKMKMKMEMKMVMKSRRRRTRIGKRTKTRNALSCASIAKQNVGTIQEREMRG